MRGIHRSPVNSLHKGQWRRAFISSTFPWIPVITCHLNWRNDVCQNGQRISRNLPALQVLERQLSGSGHMQNLIRLYQCKKIMRSYYVRKLIQILLCSFARIPKHHPFHCILLWLGYGKSHVAKNLGSTSVSFRSENFTRMDRFTCKHLHDYWFGTVWYYTWASHLSYKWFSLNMIPKIIIPALKASSFSKSNLLNGRDGIIAWSQFHLSRYQLPGANSI